MKNPTCVFSCAAASVVLAMLSGEAMSQTTPPVLGVDRNRDGISDVYQAMHPGIGSGGADADGDGFTNAAEAAAGTDPRNPADTLGFSSLDTVAGNIQAQWRSVNGKRYQVQASGDLAGAWNAEGGMIDGNGGTLGASCPQNGSRMFLRIEVTDTDTDGDGVTDWEELQAGTDRYLWDTDGDGRGDYEQVSAMVDEASVVSIVAADAWATEYGKNGSWRIVRRGGFAPLVVPFTVSGTATPGVDYTLSATGQVVLPAGATSATVTLTAFADEPLEEGETVTLTLGAGSGYTTEGPPGATVTIVSQGLIGQYFNGSSGTYTFTDVTGNFNPAQLALTRRDPRISFDWGAGTPAPEIVNDDSYSIRWSGFIIPKYRESYTIRAIADRGVKVYISPVPITAASGQLRIDQWSTTSPTTNYTATMLSSAAVTDGVTGAVPVPGRPYYIVVDYRDSSTFTNNANIELRWSSASQPEEIIPVSAFTTDGFVGQLPVISGPLVTTAVAGAPFSWQISASNLPTSYAAWGLPSGLSVNPTTGLISGTVAAESGYYFATVAATNGAGTDIENLTIYVVSTGGRVTYETWSGVAGSSAEGILPVPVHTEPTTTAERTTMQAPDNSGDYLGDRFRGWLTPPVSGNYTFFVTADENAELWLSSGVEPGRRLKRSWITAGNVPAGSWNGVATQRSLPVSLKAGERYYIEAVRRETTGGDHFAVAWQKPGDAAPEVIPGYALSPFTSTAGPGADGTIYIAHMKPQGGAATLGSGTAVLHVNAAKTEATLSFSYTNLSGGISSQHIHDGRSAPGPVGAIIFDIDDEQPDSKGERHWEFIPTGNHTVADIVACIEGGQAYINLHTQLYPDGEIKGFFQPVIGSQFFVPPPAPPAAELTLPADGSLRRREVARFLQQATFGARPDADGVAPWDPDSIEAVEALGYAGWIDAQLAMDRGPDPETLVTQSLPPRIVYVEPTAGLRTLRSNTNATGFNGSGPMATYVKTYYDRFPLSGVGTVGAPLESSGEIWRAWWRTAVTAPDQLRQRVAFALSQIFVVSEDGELDEQARALVHYNDLLYWHGLGNFRNLIEKVTLNPTMGRYLDMLNNRKPNPATGYIPNENYAREILQLFSIGLRRLHPDGTMVLDGGGRPIATYDQPEVVGFAHTFTGWIQPSSGSNYVLPMIPRASDHDIGQKLLLENTVIPSTTSATTASCNAELAAALDVIFHHPNVGPFISRQLIQRLVTVNPSAGYIYRVARVFDNNGAGVRGDMAAVVKALLLDPEARNAAMRQQPGFGHLKEPVVRATQMLRAFRGFSYGEVNYGNANTLGTVVASPNLSIDLALPIPPTGFTLVGSTALFPGNVVNLTNQNPAADNGVYVFNGTGQPLTRWTDPVNPPPGASTAVTLSTDVADITQPLPVSNRTVVEGIPLVAGNLVLLRNQFNAAENGVYVVNAVDQPLTRWSLADEPAELNGAVVTVAAYRDPATLAYSSRTFQQTATVEVVGTSPVVFGDGSTTNAGRRAWEMGTTGGGSFEQTPLRAPTVFNFYEPDYVFLGESGVAGLYSPEFQITSETSVVNTGNWFYEMTRRTSNAAAAHTQGQGYSYGGSIGRDIKLDMTPQLGLAGSPGALLDDVATLIMPGQMTPRLRTLVSSYLGGLPLTGSTVLLPLGSTWSWYTDAAGLGASDVVDGHAQWSAANWKHPDFNAAAWASGPAPLGYRATGTPLNSGIATVLPFGASSTSKWITCYYRTEFDLASTAGIPSVSLRMRRDDGAIVYVNGREAYRTNFNAGTVVTGTTLASGAGDDGNSFVTATLPASLLRDGRNVVTVEVHQNSASSSDSYMDLELSSPTMSNVDRMTRIGEALYLLSLSPEFAHQN